MLKTNSRKSLFKKLIVLLAILFLSATAKGEDFTVKADKIETDAKKGLIYLYGNCLIEGKGLKLTADRVKFDKNKGVIIAEGNVVFEKNNVVGEGEKLIFYKDSSQATILKGKLILESNFRFYAEEITYLSEDRYQLKNCYFTTCPECCRYWDFKASKINLKKEGYAGFHSLKFRIKEKSVFYLPLFVYPAKTKRSFGLLVPEIGNSSKHGFNYNQELFIPIGQSQDVTLGIDYYSKAGTGTSFEYREAFRKGEFLKFKIYSIKDTIIDQRRTIGEFNYIYQKNPDNTVQFKSFFGDDYNIVKDYTFHKYNLAMRDFYGYGSYYKRLNSKISFGASFYARKPVFKDGAVYSATPELYLEGDNFSFLKKKIGFSVSTAIISDDRISADQIARNTVNIDSLKFFRVKGFVLKEKISLKSYNYSDSQLKSLSSAEFSYTLLTPVLYREYSSFTHTVQPFIQTGYRDNSDKISKTVYHDYQDFVNPSGFFVKAGVNSYFSYNGKTGFLSFFGEKNISKETYPDPNAPDYTSEFANMGAYLSLPITDKIQFETIALYNPATNSFDTLSVGTKIYNVRVTYFRGYVYGDSETRNSLIASMITPITSNWKASFAFDYDFSLNDFRYKRLTLSYYKKCLGVNITYRNNSYSTTTTNQFTVSLVLRNIGELFKYRLGL